MRKNITILMASMLLLVAACGGSDDPAADDTDTTDAAAVADDTVAADDTMAADDTVATGDDDDDADAGGGGGDGAGFFSSERCLDLALAFSQAASMGAGTTGSPEDSAQALRNLADAAPPEIADDLGIVAEAFGEFARVLSDAGVDFSDPTTFSDPAVQGAIAEASESFNTEAIEAASTRVSDYISAECENG